MLKSFLIRMDGVLGLALCVWVFYLFIYFFVYIFVVFYYLRLIETSFLGLNHKQEIKSHSLSSAQPSILSGSRSSEGLLQIASGTGQGTQQNGFPPGNSSTYHHSKRFPEQKAFQHLLYELLRIPVSLYFLSSALYTIKSLFSLFVNLFIIKISF